MVNKTIFNFRNIIKNYDGIEKRKLNIDFDKSLGDIGKKLVSYLSKGVDVSKYTEEDIVERLSWLGFKVKGIIKSKEDVVAISDTFSSPYDSMVISLGEPTLGFELDTGNLSADEQREKGLPVTLNFLFLIDNKKVNFPFWVYYKREPWFRFSNISLEKLIALSDVVKIVDDSLLIYENKLNEYKHLRYKHLISLCTGDEDELNYYNSRLESGSYDISRERTLNDLCSILIGSGKDKRKAIANRFLNDAIVEVWRSAYRSIIVEQGIRKYEKDLSSDYARSWETKKNIPLKVQEAMKNSPFLNSGFLEVEYDAETDLSKLPPIYKNWVSLYEVLPKPKEKVNSLRFRKLGNHKASGLYFPAVNCIAVDLRTITSMVHEYGHYLDRKLPLGAGDLSLEDDFQEIYNPYFDYLSKYKDKELSTGKFDFGYYTTPTEVFARAFEIFVSSEIDVNYVLVNSITEYRKELPYKFLIENYDLVLKYFTNLFNKYNCPIRKAEKVDEFVSNNDLSTGVSSKETENSIEDVRKEYGDKGFVFFVSVQKVRENVHVISETKLLENGAFISNGFIVKGKSNKLTEISLSKVLTSKTLYIDFKKIVQKNCTAILSTCSLNSVSNYKELEARVTEIEALILESI